jgi:hypothetical protein
VIVAKADLHSFETEIPHKWSSRKRRKIPILETSLVALRIVRGTVTRVVAFLA